MRPGPSAQLRTFDRILDLAGYFRPDGPHAVSVGLEVKSTSEAMCCYPRKCMPSSLYLSNRRPWVVDDSVFHPIKRAQVGSVASDPTLHGSAGQLCRPGPPQVPKGGTTTVEPRNTAVNRCPTQAPPKIMSRPVSSVDCLSPALRQGQACRPGLSTRNFGFVLGCCLETTHINFMCHLE